MNGQRILHAFNDGCQVEKDGEIVDIQEDVPPFAVVVLGAADKDAGSLSRDEHAVWKVQKPGVSSSLYRPEILAFNGPNPIKYKGYGEVTQDWPTLARVSLLGPDGQKLAKIPQTHESWGVANDSWALTPNGGLFTNLGLDTTTAKELGATEGKAGKWSKLPDEAIAWVRPRPPETQWMTGWRTAQTIDRVTNYDPYESPGETPVGMLVDPRRSIRYRLQQPWQPVEESVRLYTPINDDIDHKGNKGETEAKFQVKRVVRWVKVREAGTYHVSFSAAIGIDVPTWYTWTGIGLFAAWPDKPTAKKPEYQCVPWPAAVATRRPPGLDYSGTVWDSLAGADVTIDLTIVDQFEHVSASTVMEIGAGWAFGFVVLGDNGVNVHHFQVNVNRLGPPANVEKYWEQQARKIDYYTQGGDDWLEDEEDSTAFPDTIEEYPVKEPQKVLLANQPAAGFPPFDLPDTAV